MIRPARLLTVLTIALFFTACKKEMSAENGGITGGPTSPPLGDNCRVEKISSIDSTSGIGLSSLSTQFGTNDLATKTELFDSLSNSLTYAANFTYASDTIRINDKEYFLVDPSVRIKEFNTLADPTDPNSVKLVFKYYYDAGGYLIKKEIYQESITVPITVNYTWTNGNLTAIEANVAGQLKVLNGELEYYTDKTAKNFVYIIPEAYELSPYILALNVGNKSKNLPKKVVMRLYDNSGNISHTYTTAFSNFKFTADGYVNELYASGDNIDGIQLYGLTKFSYRCK
jgi:hypothetical protein